MSDRDDVKETVPVSTTDEDTPGAVIPAPRTSPENEPAEVPARGRRWSRRSIAATAVLALAVLLAGALLLAAQQLRDPAARGNRALTDAAATDQVTGDVSNALSRIFAYTPDDTQSTAQAARDVLAGAAATQYQQLFARIRQQVADQKLTLTTRVVRAGVVSLTSGHARLLVFLDQTAQRAGARATSAAAQLSVTAEFTGGRWRITDLKAR
jgi:Mce-associated membrane protein